MKLKHIIGGIAVAAIAAAGIKLSSHRAGPDNIYPQIPGKTNPNVTQANIQDTICKSGWTATIRPPASYTTALKIQQLKQYGNQDQAPKDYEEDHFISLELGGDPKDPQNLWPEPYFTPDTSQGARSKDRVENYLNTQVCAGNISLQEAQKEITTDWYQIYAKVYGGTLGASPQSNDPDDE